MDGVVAADELEQLPQALAAIDSGFVPASRRVMTAAKLMPRLSERQSKVLAALLCGLSYPSAAGRLNVSEATIKRDIQELCAAFGIDCREQLLSAAVTAGISPTAVSV